jgi:SAM-dependent methyltransferase
LIDSLVRVGLTTDPAAVRLTTLDISPRVNDHLRRSRQRAAAGQPYRIRLPLERNVSWKPAAVEYWKVAGDRVGTVSPPVRATVAGANVDVRTVAVRPAVALRLEPVDLNIVVQRSDTHRFDLIVATNVFVYYDVLEQVLALSNVRSMLKPGGLLLSNNALLELPATRMRSVGYVTVEYSDLRDDGDHIVWYRAE